MLLAWQAEKATSLSDDVAEPKQPTAFLDDVEQIAVLASRRIGPLASGTLPRTRSAQPNKHRPTGRVVDVSNDPVPADTPTIVEIVAADEFGLLGKQACEIRGLGWYGRSPI